MAIKTPSLTWLGYSTLKLITEFNYSPVPIQALQQLMHRHLFGNCMSDSINRRILMEIDRLCEAKWIAEMYEASRLHYYLTARGREEMQKFARSPPIEIRVLNY